MTTKEETEEITLSELSDAEAKDFNTHLKEAMSTDLSDLERTGCVSRGRDLKNNHVIVLVTHLGLIHGERPEVSFRRMLLLFIRKANEIVGAPYSVVYAHTGFDIMNQYPLIYKFYSILPRPYKKNLLGMHVIHPNVGIRMFFEFSRVFLSHKFYNKLCLYETILDFQRFIPPTQLQLPHKFLRKEDEDRDLKYCGHMASLDKQFNKVLGTSRVLHICATYLREKGAFQQRGLFRVAGDEGELSLIKVRLQYAHRGIDGRERIHLSENNDYIIVGDVSLLSKPGANQSIESSNLKQEPPTPHATPMSAKKTTKKEKKTAAKNVAVENNSKIGMSSGDLSSSSSAGRRGSNSAKNVQTTEDDSMGMLPEEVPNSIVIVTNINTVAQVFKMAISHLPEPVVPGSIYTDVINLTRKFEPTGFNMDWEKGIAAALSDLPFPNLSTLVYVIRFLREVSAESAINSMDSTNLAIIFAPNVFRSDMIDPMKAVMEMRLSKIIVRELIDRRYILQQAMHLNTHKRTSGKSNSAHATVGAKDSNDSKSDYKPSSTTELIDDKYADCKFIFENPIGNESQELLGNGLSGKLNAEDVREITDGFGPKLMSRLNMDVGSGRGSRSRSSNAMDRNYDDDNSKDAEESLQTDDVFVDVGSD